MPYGIKVSQTGNDVKTCDDDKLIIDSSKECLKIVDCGEFNFTIDNIDGWGYQEKVYNHNLGYVPVHYVFFKCNFGINSRRICEEDERTVYEASFTCGAYATSSQLVFWVNCVYPEYVGKIVNFKYYIFANPIEPQPLPRISSEGPWLDVVYGDLTLGVNFSKPSPTPGIIKDANYGDLSFGG